MAGLNPDDFPSEIAYWEAVAAKSMEALKKLGAEAGETARNAPARAKEKLGFDPYSDESPRKQRDRAREEEYQRKISSQE